MSIIKLRPIETETINAMLVRITGIDCSTVDFLVGTVETPTSGEVPKCWDDKGRCEDSEPSCNLDILRPEVSLLIKVGLFLKSNIEEEDEE